MVDLTQRADPAQLPELMDGPCSYEEMRRCLRDIARVNRLTRAHHPTLDFLARATAALPGTAAPLRIIDLGCGYGDTLRRIERWAAARRVEVELLGVDLNPDAVRAARQATPSSSRIHYVAGDVLVLPEAQSADLIVCSLVMHHVPEAGIVALLGWMERTARRGWFLCDLHRMPVPYRLFSALMHGPWWHRFIRVDGLTSIRRSFREDDWVRMTEAARVRDGVVLRRYVPARLCVERLRGDALAGR